MASQDTLNIFNPRSSFVFNSSSPLNSIMSAPSESTGLLDVERNDKQQASSSSSSPSTGKYAAWTTLAVLTVIGFVAVQMRGGFATSTGLLQFGTSPDGKISPAGSSKSSSTSSSSTQIKTVESPTIVGTTTETETESKADAPATESSSSSSSSSTTTTTITSTKEAGEIAIKYTELDSDTKKNLFRDFKINYEKAYKDSKEESFRMQQFDSFLERVDQINAKNFANGGEGTVHGITKFADYTQDEFTKMFMGYIPADEVTKKSRMTQQKAITVHPMSSTKSSVDWTGVYTTSVNDQDRCASSWAWTASQQVESDAIRLGLMALDDTNKLSPQQILDCDTADMGCEGGNTQTAFETIFKDGGLHYLSEYPYATTSARAHVNMGCENLESSKALTLDKVNSYTWLYAGRGYDIEQSPNTLYD